MALRQINRIADASASINVQYERESKQGALGYWDIEDDEVAVLRSCTLTIGSRHPNDFGQVLNKIDVELVAQTVDGVGVGPSNLWKVTGTYGPWNPAELGDPAQAGNPFSPPARYRLEWQTRPEPVWADINGKPIVNSAGDLFDPPIEIDRLIGIITVERAENISLNIPGTLALSGKVNASSWNGFEPKTVRVAPIGLPSLEYSQESNQFYYPMTYVFEWNPNTWTREPLDAGYRQRISGKSVTILDDSGQPLSSPGLLDGHGNYLKPPVASSDLTLSVVEIYEPTDFSVFNLDDLFVPPDVLS